MPVTAWARFKMHTDRHVQILVGISEEQNRTWASLNDVVMGRSVMPVNILYTGRMATDH